MATAQYNVGDNPRHLDSPRPRGRENASSTPCRNITIYGFCRHQKIGSLDCDYCHDSAKLTDEAFRGGRFDVNSPSFIPLKSTTNTRAQVSPKSVVNAPVFTPKSSGPAPMALPIAFSSPGQQLSQPEWTGGFFRQIVPATYMSTPDPEPPLLGHPIMPPPFNPFTTAPPPIADPVAGTHVPFLAETSGTTFYHDPATTYSQPLRYHLYAPVPPVTPATHPYYRQVQDFFIPDSLREELQRKAEDVLNYTQNPSLPLRVDQFHSLVSIEMSKPGQSTIFGHVNWLYKAVSIKDGRVYLLRRLEGFRLNKEQAIHSIQAWKQINHSSIVTVHDAFTTRAFGDSSLVFVTDYHPLSKTLAEEYPQPKTRFNNARTSQVIPEETLWNYLVQILLALRTIHSSGLAAQSISPSKVILTCKNQVRLTSCGVMDVISFETRKPTHELQAADIHQLGRLILSLAIGNLVPSLDLAKDMEKLPRTYSDQLKDVIAWLLGPTHLKVPENSNLPKTRDLDLMVAHLADRIAKMYESARQADDIKTSHLSRELENGRLVRLLCKLGMINERAEFANDPIWSETGDRYCLKLFRDYVFHQVDASGRPVTNLGHIITCLNKLDAGIEEKIQLTSRDDQNVLVISYSELKQCLEGAFKDILKAQSGISR